MERTPRGSLEVVPVDIPGESARNAQVAFNECPIDDQLRLLVRDLTGRPGLDLLADRIEIKVGNSNRGGNVAV